MEPPEAPAPATILRRSPGNGDPRPPAPGASAPMPVPMPEVPAEGTRVARAVLGAIALALVAFSGYLLWERGFVLTLHSLAGLTMRLVLAAVLAALALRPGEAARVLRAPRLNTPAGLAAAALVAGALYFVFGLGTVVETARLVEEAQAGVAPNQDLDIDRLALLLSLGINFLVFTIPAVAWAAWAEGWPGPRAYDWLGLKRQGLRWSIAWSLLAVLLVFWLLVLAGITSRVMGQGDVENPRAEAIARALDIPSALLVAALTGIGEEVFFRGWLQRKVGNVPQAVLFGLAHLNYFHFLEVAVTALLGYGFGRAVQKTGNLWGPILGHAAFNATSLLIIIAKSNGWVAWI